MPGVALAKRTLTLKESKYDMKYESKSSHNVLLYRIIGLALKFPASSNINIHTPHALILDN